MRSRETLADKLAFESDAFFHGDVEEVLAEPGEKRLPGLALLVDHDDELDHALIMIPINSDQHLIAIFMEQDPLAAVGNYLESIGKSITSGTRR